MPRQLDNPFYYLDNFKKVLDWIALRYPDLLDPEESQFIARFHTLPQAAQALLVRMVMRKGDIFRESKLQYPEIGFTAAAAAPLITQGWLNPAPVLSLAQIFQIFTKPELIQLFQLPPSIANAKKAIQLATVREALLAQGLDDSALDIPQTRQIDGVTQMVYQLQISPLADRFRLMFFGNLHQDWTEFVLADLGIYTYETVAFSDAARGFQCRADIDHYFDLSICREQWQQGTPSEAILARLQQLPHSPQSWLELRRAKLLFQIGQQYEREKNWPAALPLYQNNPAPDARVRCLRVLMHSEQFDAAHTLAQQIQQAGSEAEQQQLSRILPRLQRKLKTAVAVDCAAPPATAKWEEITLTLPYPDTPNPQSVEQLAAQHLSTAGAPVFYVENTLINSLFGLLCWEAVFAALPGAFFHPYQHGPADFFSADFYTRRQTQFEQCLHELNSDEYLRTIRRRLHEKAGLQSPFVFWQVLSSELLELALRCLPAQHLQYFFRRILADLKNNRSGLPDLIQFLPESNSYRMIEVKGPGDRLQDNQIRWLDYFSRHQMPVLVCYVQYQTKP
jgi:hypothetical protein